ncbi:hypothetical protein BDV93DRAFT_517477 [Ceratobasidium sp. AG-I]|nr:hypothetical protein BDV93DRAFT_517477 [Ceratobasidium sp. AG-I]
MLPDRSLHTLAPYHATTATCAHPYTDPIQPRIGAQLRSWASCSAASWDQGRASPLASGNVRTHHRP